MFKKDCGGFGKDSALGMPNGLVVVAPLQRQWLWWHGAEPLFFLYLHLRGKETLLTSLLIKMFHIY